MYDSLLEHDLDDETSVVGDVAADLEPKLEDDDTETDELADDLDPATGEVLEDAELDAESLLDATDTES